MDPTRRAILRWMTGVMEGRGWTAAAWARRAGVTPTNLTRFLHDPVNGGLPRAETIGRLARAAGSEPRFLDHAPTLVASRVPLLVPAQVEALMALGGRGAESFLESALRDGAGLTVDRPTSRRAFALRIGSRSLDGAGVLPDDRVVLEPTDLLAPRPGDVVVTVSGDAVRGYRYFPPQLVPVSTDPGCVATPFAEAPVAGVAVQVVRALRPAE